jgi:ubiquinone/menaquinone biosynthesis C-methylase UbiE
MDKKILDRYNSPEGASSYAGKFKRRWTERINDWHEHRLVRRLLRMTSNEKPITLALDLPCGYGRLYPVVQETSERVVEGDWSFHLLSLARKQQVVGRSALGYVRATALSLPFPDSAFDLVLSVRLCHHIRDHTERLQYVREIMRVSGQWAIFTYFDRDSVKNRLREWRQQFNKKRSKWTLSLSEIETLADEAGFDVVCSVLLSSLFSGHRYVVLRHSSGISK